MHWPNFETVQRHFIKTAANFCFMSRSKYGKKTLDKNLALGPFSGVVTGAIVVNKLTSAYVYNAKEGDLSAFS